MILLPENRFRLDGFESVREFEMSRFVIAVAAMLLVAQSANAQQRPAVGTTVQLPTLSRFSVNTTVSVPDGGTMYLGGIRRGAEGSARRRGLRSRGRTIGGPGVSVSAKLIIGSEVDAELERRGRLALARKARPDIHGTESEKARASFIARNLGRGWK